MSFLRGLLSSATEDDKQQGGFETIEKLCDRLETATLLDDRRDAIRALRALSKSFQVEVGTHAMDMLINVIKEDSTDVEITEMVIETLLNVMASKGEDQPPATDLGVQFTEMFIKSEDNVSLLLSLLEEYEFHVRWPTVKLLILLLKNRSKDLQDRVLESPMGISKLMDLLSDSREIIRNDGLLLMIKLTKNNPAIQKIVAFENAFERLLHIVTVEGNSDGGIIVEDCLSLLLNLLRNNLSNQNFFRETSNIQRITPYFQMEEPDDEKAEVDAFKNSAPFWNIQKQNNILLMLDIIQVLISPTNNSQSVTLCQKTMYTRGIYMRLMDMLLFPSLPPEIFSRLMLTVGDMVRGNEIIQQFMEELELSDRPAILVILMYMVNDKQPFKIRVAALYCIQCFLYKNQKGQAAVVSTLLPDQEDVQTGVTSGQLLCAGLFSADPVAHWLCSVTLAHCLYNNSPQHDNMLLVQLELTVGQPPVHLINQVFNMLVNELNYRTRFGTLMLLLHWVEDAPGAVCTLLSNPAFVPQILQLVEHRDGEDASVSLMSSLAAMLLGLCLKYNDNSCEQYTKPALFHLITHRVGKDNFAELLESASLKPLFTQASKTPHPTANVVDDLALDFCFTKFYKKQLDIVTRVLEGEEEEPEIHSHDEIVSGYKDLIKQQDDEINRLRLALAGSKPREDDVTGTDITAPALTEQLVQMQEYAKSQEHYYQQYIVQLQTWYSEQMTELQASHIGDAQQSTICATEVTAHEMTSLDDGMTSRDSEVTSRDTEAVSLERRCDELELHKKEQESTISRLKDSLSEQDAKLQVFKQEKQQQEQYISEMVAEVDTFKTSVADSQNHHGKEVTELQRQLAEQNALNADLASQLLSNKHSLAHSQAESEYSLQKLTEAEYCLAHSQAESESLKLKLTEVERSRAESEALKLKLAEVERSRAESETLQLKLAEAERSQAESECLQQKLTEAERSQAHSQAESESLKLKLAEVERSRAESEALKLKLAEVERSRAESETLQQKLTEVENSQAESESLQQKLTEVERSRAESESLKLKLAEAERCRAESETLQQKLTEVENSQAESESLQQKLTEAELRVSALQDELQEAKQKLKYADDELSANHVIITQLQDLQLKSERSPPEKNVTEGLVQISSSSEVNTDQETLKLSKTATVSPQKPPETILDPPQTTPEPPQATPEPPQAIEDPPQATPETPQAIEDPPQVNEAKQYLYNYSEWFKAIVSDDGVTYYQSTDGHIYTEEQYILTLDQYDAYYRSLAPQNGDIQEQKLQENSEQQNSEQQHSEQQNSEQQHSEQQKTENINEELKIETDTEAQKNSEVARLQDLVKNYELDMELLKQKIRDGQDQTTLKKHLSMSATTHEDIEGATKVLHRSDVNHTEIEGQVPERRSSTPELTSETEITALQEKYETLSTEQDDLLVLLAHQDKKLALLKDRLRLLGDECNFSESDDDFDDLMDSCEDLPKTSELTVDGRLA